MGFTRAKRGARHNAGFARDRRKGMLYRAEQRQQSCATMVQGWATSPCTATIPQPPAMQLACVVVTSRIVCPGFVGMLPLSHLRHRAFDYQPGETGGEQGSCRSVLRSSRAFPPPTWQRVQQSRAMMRTIVVAHRYQERLQICRHVCSPMVSIHIQVHIPTCLIAFFHVARFPHCILFLL